MRNTEKYDENIWIQFAYRVGWRKGGNWLNQSESNFNLSAPKAHLPRIDFIDARRKTNLNSTRFESLILSGMTKNRSNRSISSYILSRKDL